MREVTIYDVLANAIYQDCSIDGMFVAILLIENNHYSIADDTANVSAEMIGAARHCSHERGVQLCYCVRMVFQA